MYDLCQISARAGLCRTGKGGKRQSCLETFLPSYVGLNRRAFYAVSVMLVHIVQFGNVSLFCYLATQTIEGRFYCREAG